MDELTVLVVGGEQVPPAALQTLPIVAVVAAADAAQAVRANGPSAVVVDLDAAGALDAVRALAQACSDIPGGIPIIAIAADTAPMLAGVRAGATGFVLRADARLPTIVSAATAGGSAFGDGLAERVLEAAIGDQVVGPRLTDRESEILQLVVEGLTSRQIASQLVVSPRTVENHIQHILRKLGVPGRAALVRYAIEHGLA